ncbi:spore cortex biosynthesis protein YabQ [Phosphitispora fastidiosa]|uniref:spore cortex biosynthesis protein YabQ n=1 Tax=Phosphitispora fastidiosa TaxID=2837202 RepID=UPI001E506832|nr:spore cortex biosynthesis protein YabQ [Phosphitispora fastidiosa]MBU7007804.1 spore cortex biosynthesis protein YabQ [Phosphitispora fastidiosa]
MQSLESQFFSFLVTLLMGLTIGILFDFYNVTKGIIRPRKAGTYLGDLLFWVITTIVVFFMLLIGNWGELRFYVIIGILAGVVCYIKFLSPMVIKILLYIICFFKTVLAGIAKGLRFFWFIVSYPVILLGNIIIIPVGLLGRTCNKLCSFTGRQSERFIKKPAREKSVLLKKNIKNKLNSLVNRKP